MTVFYFKNAADHYQIACISISLFQHWQFDTSESTWMVPGTFEDLAA
jgi:hypothetical protein